MNTARALGTWFQAAVAVALVGGTLVGGTLGCAGEGAEGVPSELEAEETATATFELTTVAPSVQCIRVTATPASGTASSKNFTVTAGSSSASLQFNKVVPGSYTFTGEAFNVACASIGSVGDWVADPVSVTLRAGVRSTVALTLRKNETPAVSANFVNNVLAVSLGASNTFIASDFGLLQAGNMNASRTFARVPFSAFDSSSVPGNAISRIFAMLSGVCALRADGTVWCWGTPSSNEVGPGTTTAPTQLTTMVAELASSGSHSCAIRAPSTARPALVCWGRSDYGQSDPLRVFFPSNPPYPFDIGLADIPSAVATGGNSTYVINQDRALVVFGYNAYGQLGLGMTSDYEGVSLVDEAPLRQVAAGLNHACGLRLDGSVRCWGRNHYGQLGIGTTTNASSPTVVRDTAGTQITATHIAAGANHTCALGTDGKLRCWGHNEYGQIGDGTNANRLSPVVVSLSGVTIASIATMPRANGTCLTTTASEVYCWGRNSTDGQLGDGTLTNIFQPYRVQLQ